MSATKIELTEPAKKDLHDLLLFTFQKWGRKQLGEYKKKIDRALKAIAKNPDLGIQKYGLMIYPVGRHKIFYRVENKVAYVFRILHEHMDASEHLR